MQRTELEEQLERAGGDGGELSAGRLRMGMNGHGGGETSTKKAKANPHPARNFPEVVPST